MCMRYLNNISNFMDNSARIKNRISIVRAASSYGAWSTPL